MDREKKNWTLGFELLGWNIAARNFKTEKVADTALRAAWFWPTFGRFAETWGIFFNPRDSKLICDGFGFQWNGQRKNIWTLDFELLGRNIAQRDFKTEKSSRNRLSRSVILPTLDRFPGTWDIFSNPRESKLNCNGLGFQWNGQRKNNWTLGFQLLGWNIAPLHFRTEKVADTALRAAWFWPTLAPFPGTWVIFTNPRDSKLTYYGLGF